MSLPIVYIQIAEEGRIIELRLESFDMADDLAEKIKALGTRVVSEQRWTPEPVAPAANIVKVAVDLPMPTGAWQLLPSAPINLTDFPPCPRCGAHDCPGALTPLACNKLPLDPASEGVQH